MLGVGGGFLMVPLQVIWARTPLRRASGNSLAAIVPIAIVGASVYYFGGGPPQLDLAVSIYVMIGSSAGAVVGSRLSPIVPERALKLLVSVLMVVAALKELSDALLGSNGLVDASSRAEPGVIAIVLIILSGLLIGIISGLTGIGGGVLLVPARRVAAS